MPKVSVLMPVHNGLPYLSMAIRSILKQTCQDFELVAIDDASTDDSWNVLNSFSDTRIKLLKNEKNLGLAATLNRGLDVIDSQFIARMDCDDICVRRRLEWQVCFMEDHPTVGISGMRVLAFGHPAMSGLIRYPVGCSTVAASLLFYNPICHPVSIMNTEMINRYGLRYDPTFSRSEDYDLWSRGSHFFSLENLDCIGLYLRRHGASVTSCYGETMSNQVRVILTRCLSEIGIEMDEQVLSLHYRIGQGERIHNLDELDQAREWLRYVKSVASGSKRYTAEGLDRAIGHVWYTLCANSTPATRNILSYYRDSDLRQGYRPTWNQWMLFVGSTVWNHSVKRFKFRS